MPFSTDIAGQSRPATRPASAEELLFHPIRAKPSATLSPTDGDWVKEHGTKQRFYVGGLEWLIDTAGLSTEIIASHRKTAAEKIGQTGWLAGLTGNVRLKQQLKGAWGAIARQQYFEVGMARPVLFAKAALFILSCEIALEETIKNKRLPPNASSVVSGAEVYSRMAIVPACWYVTGFDRTYLASQIASSPNFLMDLTIHTGQAKPELIEDAAAGYTVTYETARLISEFCANHNLAGAPRCAVGRSTLGSGHASNLEMIDL